MQYSEVLSTAKLDRADMINICLTRDITPEQVMREYYKIENDAELWRLSHREYGVLLDVSRKFYKNSYIVTLTWETSKPDKYGNRTKSARSNFYVGERMYNYYMSLVSQHCCFYISYTENEQDKSVYRVLLNAQPTSELNR